VLRQRSWWRLRHESHRSAEIRTGRFKPDAPLLKKGYQMCQVRPSPWSILLSAWRTLERQKVFIALGGGPLLLPLLRHGHGGARTARTSVRLRIAIPWRYEQIFAAPNPM